jgi:uncharacterized protein
MSEANIEVIRALYERANRGDMDGVFDLCHPDAEWESDPRVLDGGVHRGREEVQRFLDDQAAPFDAMVVEPERLIAKDDSVVALIRVRGRPRGSTAEFELRIAHLWTLRDGKVARGQGFAVREQALDAVGLPRSSI